VLSLVLCVAITLFLVVLAARAVLSWFPNQPGGVLEQVQSLLNTLTEPVLRPVRQVIPPAGMFDLSFLVVFIGLFILRRIICG
jgi:YggT family protein